MVVLSDDWANRLPLRIESPDRPLPLQVTQTFPADSVPWLPPQGGPIILSHGLGAAMKTADRQGSESRKIVEIRP